jgi:hypothetical protein
VPPWLSPVERLAVNQSLIERNQSLSEQDRNQSVKGSNPFGGATSQLHLYCCTIFINFANNV